MPFYGDGSGVRDDLPCIVAPNTPVPKAAGPLPVTVIAPVLVMPPATELFVTLMAAALPVPFTLIAPVFMIPAPIVLLATPIAAVLPPPIIFPGLIVPALVTAPVTVELMMMIEVVVCPAGFVTLGTVWFVSLRRSRRQRDKKRRDRGRGEKHRRVTEDGHEIAPRKG